MSNVRSVTLLVLAAMLSACGSGGSSSETTVTTNPGGNSPPQAPAPIEGIELPSSVSVVTATNAG
jgi:hypothetical protein